MLDDQLTFRRAIADLSYLTTAGGYNYGQVQNLTADGAITDAGANTNFKVLAEAMRNPYTPTALFVDMPGVSGGGGMTTTATGTITAAKLTLTITFSDDGTNPVGQTITADVQNVAVTSNAGVVNTKGYIHLPPHNHGWMKVAWATSFTGGSAQTAAWGPLGLYGVVSPSNLNGVDMTNRG